MAGEPRPIGAILPDVVHGWLGTELARITELRQELFQLTRGLVLSVPALLELRRLLFEQASVDELEDALSHFRGG